MRTGFNSSWLDVGVGNPNGRGPRKGSFPRLLEKRKIQNWSLTRKGLSVILPLVEKLSGRKKEKKMNPIECEKCEEEKSPFEIVVSEYAINVNGENFLEYLTETTPMIVCGNCEAEMEAEENG